MNFWDYGKHDLDGYVQPGNSHGEYYGTWLKQLEYGRTIVISYGDRSERFWLQIGDCLHGSHATKEMAAREAEDIVRSECCR